MLRLRALLLIGLAACLAVTPARGASRGARSVAAPREPRAAAPPREPREPRAAAPPQPRAAARRESSPREPLAAAPPQPRGALLRPLAHPAEELRAAGRAYRLDLDAPLPVRDPADRGGARAARADRAGRVDRAPTGPPDAVLYVPAGFDARPPLSVVVYLHGFYNCAENVLRDEDGPCAPGGAPRRAHALARQLEESGRNALLISAETAFDRRSGSPGALGAPGGLRRLLEEALRALRPRRSRGIADLGRVALFAHSAGYQAAAAVVQKGGVAVQELYLLDALYGSVGDFADWLRADLRSLLGPRPARRFASVASPGGTLEQTEDLARDVRRWLRGAPATEPGLLFERAPLSHAELPRRYFGWLLGRSGLPMRQRVRVSSRPLWPRSL